MAQTRACHPSVALFHPYYGMDYSDEELDAIRNLRRAGCHAIEDLTHSLFAPRHDDVFACRVGSVRKWFPVPDGEILDTSVEVNEPVMAFHSLYIPQLVAMKLRAKYFESSDINLKALSIQLNKFAEQHARGPLTAYAISGYTLSALAELDVGACSTRRLDNFRTLLVGLADCPSVELSISDMGRVVGAPLYFPLYVDGNREAIQARMAVRSIYAPVLWTPASTDVLIDDTARKIYDRVLAIPCDQRYATKDMKRVVEAIRAL